ncbi:MAG TPA: hypothetical protein VGY31_09825 [Terriglobia bacterium]|nr:hypothetical protein [Terriglobia bacterium]
MNFIRREKQNVISTIWLLVTFHLLCYHRAWTSDYRKTRSYDA